MPKEMNVMIEIRPATLYVTITSSRNRPLWALRMPNSHRRMDDFIRRVKSELKRLSTDETKRR